MDSERGRRPTLGPLDAVSLVVGIVIGAGIFRAPPDVFRNVPDAATGMALWALGGLLAFVGALCYAELASTYPSNGGEYVYLSRAYGPAAGFAFAWAQLAVIRTGASIAPIAYVFGAYASKLHALGPRSNLIYVTAAIAALTVVNALGLQPGRRVQNVLTAAKVLGLGGVVLAGLWLAADPVRGEPPMPTPTTDTALPLALVFVLWTYSGWHEAAYIVADTRDPTRDIVRALLLGTAAVAVIYLAVNAALLAGLGFDGLRRSDTAANDLAERAVGSAGAALMSALVMVSALGATNGTILTGGRFFAGFGELHPGFGWLGRARTRRGAPLVALIAQGTLALFMVALVETGDVWKPWYHSLGFSLRASPVSDGFAALVDCTAPVFWTFFLLTGVALVVLRVREPDRSRPFRVPLFPLVALTFCGVCAFMLYSSVTYALSQRPVEALAVAALLALGLPVYLLTRGTSAPLTPDP